MVIGSFGGYYLKSKSEKQTTVIPTSQPTPINTIVVQPTFEPVKTKVPVTISNDSVEIAKQFFRDHAADYNLQPDLQDLKLLRVASGLGSDTVHFQQLYKNIPIYGNFISVSISKKGNRPPFVTSLYDSSISLPGIIPAVSSAEAIIKAQESIGITDQLNSEPITSELIVYPQGKTSGKFMNYVLAWEIRLSTWEVFIDAAEGNLLNKRNLLVVD